MVNLRGLSGSSSIRDKGKTALRNTPALFYTTWIVSLNPRLNACETPKRLFLVMIEYPFRNILANIHGFIFCNMISDEIKNGMWISVFRIHFGKYNTFANFNWH